MDSCEALIGSEIEETYRWTEDPSEGYEEGNSWDTVTVGSDSESEEAIVSSEEVEESSIIYDIDYTDEEIPFYEDEKDNTLEETTEVKPDIIPQTFVSAFPTKKEKDLIFELLLDENYEYLFDQVLLSQNQEMLVVLCEEALHFDVLNDKSKHLSQTVLMSLIFNLAKDLDHHTALRRWCLEEALLCLDVKSDAYDYSGMTNLTYLNDKLTLFVHENPLRAESFEFLLRSCKMLLKIGSKNAQTVVVPSLSERVID